MMFLYFHEKSKSAYENNDEFYNLIDHNDIIFVVVTGKIPCGSGSATNGNNHSVGPMTACTRDLRKMGP
jgi:hypothetical protein